MKLPRFSKNVTNMRRTQRGDFLIESLIGVLLIAIVGAGIVQTSTRVAEVQRNTQEQALIINKLEGIASGGVEATICSNIDMGVEGSTYTIADACDGMNQLKTTTITIGGVAVPTKQPLVMGATYTDGASFRVGQTSATEDTGY